MTYSTKLFFKGVFYMQRKTIPWNIRQVCRMIDNGIITFNNPIQRQSGQWRHEDASLLIHSVLTLFIPDIYAIQDKKEVNGKETNIYDIIDGKQRLTLIHSFRNNEWSLTELEEITLDTGETFNISGLSYDQLPEEVRDAIDSFTLTFKVIELDEGDDEESIVEDIFYRLNNGKAVSRQHLAYISAQKHVREFVHDMVNNHHFYQVSAHFPPSSVKKSEMELSVLQSIILAAGLDYNSFAAREIERTVSQNNIDNSVLIKVRQVFDTLAEAFPKKHKKFLTKIIIPSAVMLVLNNNDRDSVVKFLKYYADNMKRGDAFKRYTGAGSTKKSMVEGRIKGLQQLYEDWLKNQ